MYLKMIRSEILKGHSEKQAIRPNKYILVQNTFNAFPCLLTLPFKDTLVYHLSGCIFLLPLQVSLSKLHSKWNMAEHRFKLRISELMLL